MALTDETNTTMLVQPAGGMSNGFGGFGGDGWWVLILFLLLGNGGWGGGFGMDGLYPWMNNSQNINSGFRDQMLNDNITSIRDGVFGISTQLCNGFAGVNSNISNGFAQSEIAANSRQMADMQQMFALQSQLASCCCDNRLATAQTQALVQSENCADRYEAAQNTQAIISAITGGIQAIKDDLCADRLEAERRENANLRSELMFARGQASQDVQTAAIQAGQRALANEVEQYVLPTPRPAYVVANPNCCQNNGCGCNGGF